MKRLLLISLTTIIGLGSLETTASADPNWYHHRESYRQAEAPKLSPIPEPLKYRVERRPETVETEVYKNDQWQKVDRYVQEHDHRRERRHQIRFRRYQYGTRNDPGRY